MDLDFKLHDQQLNVFTHPAKNKVVAAGRRGGKSFLAAVLLLIYALQEMNKEGYDVRLKEVWYIAPTFQQGKDIMWALLKDLGSKVIKAAHENTASLILINGRKIKIKGSDRPDTLRGAGLSFAVLDEFADMKPETWEEIVQPTLMEVDGDAFFIGTPKGKNHFYELWLDAGKEETEGWEKFHFKSLDNPYIPSSVIDRMKKKMSVDTYRQELEASFESGGGGVFNPREFKYADSPVEGGNIFIAVDPAGYSVGSGRTKSNLKRLDETAIAIVETSEKGWFIHDIIHGRWGVRETSLQIIKACQKYKPTLLGIEKGALHNAIMPYLEDQMRRLNIYPRMEALTHGGKKKTERITWSLQGRFQNGRIWFKEDAEYISPLSEQLLDFPNPLAHDDLIDALAYIDQLANVPYFTDTIMQNEFEPLDELAGY